MSGGVLPAGCRALFVPGLVPSSGWMGLGPGECWPAGRWGGWDRRAAGPRVLAHALVVGCILSLLVDMVGPGVAEGSEGPLAAGLLVGRTGSPQLLFGLEHSRTGACGLVGGLGPDTSKLEENS